jgi:hypothetical protein
MRFLAIAALIGCAQALYVKGDPPCKGKNEYFHAGEHGQLGAKEYKRVVPARFAADDDDIFMRSMIA